MSNDRQIHTPGEPAAPAPSPASTTAAAPAPAPAKGKPGPKPRNAKPADAAPAPSPSSGGDASGGDGGDDDLAQYDTEDLPPAPAAPPGMVSMAEVQRLLDEQAAKFQAQMVDAIRASASSQDPATAAKIAAARIEGQKLPTVDAAKAMCEDAVKKGRRPRAIETTEGWYCHPEMARVLDKGLAKLGG